jgi:hypothetical protein
MLGSNLAQPLPRVLVDQSILELATLGVLLREDVRSLDIAGVVEHNRPSFATDEVLGLAEAKSGNPAERAQRKDPARAAHAMSIVLDQIRSHRPRQAS